VDGLDLEDIFKEFGTVESAQARRGAVVAASPLTRHSLRHLRRCVPRVLQLSQVVTDRETGRSRGFGFVTMATKEESDKAARELAGANIDGRKIVVEFASEKFKEPRPE
jgi:RNA recognition motif-containing protein